VRREAANDQQHRRRPTDREEAEPAIAPSAVEKRDKIKVERNEQRIVRMDIRVPRTLEKTPVDSAVTEKQSGLQSPDRPEIPFPETGGGREEAEADHRNQRRDAEPVECRLLSCWVSTLLAGTR